MRSVCTDASHRALTETLEPPLFAPIAQAGSFSLKNLLRSRQTRKFAGLAIVLLAALVALRQLPLLAWTESFRVWSASFGSLGILIFGVVFGVAAILMVPCLPLTLLAGFTFGWLGGLGAVMIGIAIGAAFGFLAVRLLARGAVARKIEGHPQFKAIDGAIAKDGWKIVGLLRMCPVPFGLTNYLYGLTGIDFWRYMLATLVGMLPGNMMFVYLGAFGKQTAEGPRHPLEFVAGALALAAMVGVTIILRRIARRATGT